MDSQLIARILCLLRFSMSIAIMLSSITSYK